MSEVIVACLGLVGIVITYVLKQPQEKRETVNSTVSNLREDLKIAREDANFARNQSKALTTRVESLENRERRRFQYELRHRTWDEDMIRVVRKLAPDMQIPEPPPFTYFSNTEFEVLQEISDDN